LNCDFDGILIKSEDDGTLANIGLMKLGRLGSFCGWSSGLEHSDIIVLI